MLSLYYPVHSHASGREVTGMVPWPLRPCGILVTVRLPRFAARPGPALLSLGALLAAGCGAGAGTPPGLPRHPGSSVARPASPGRNPEPMDVSAYDAGMVIGYNTARTPGLGSAIFLHLNIGIATAGCVTLPPGELLPLLRWLDPARTPRIRMGVR
jgi:hypothetical protein